MASLKQLEDQIFQKEGFRVRFTPLKESTKAYPAYEREYMATNKWRISDWKMKRLEPYMGLMRAVEVMRGDGTPVKSDLKLGNLRDSYFDAHCADEQLNG